MNSYAISSCLLERTKEDKKIVTGILHKVSDENTPFKVVVDKYGVIFDIYERIANDNNVHVASWLRILTREPSQIEYLDIRLDPNEDCIINFLETASKIRNQKKLIVMSHNSLPEGIQYIDENNINYKEKNIYILNSNEAMNELDKNKGITIINENNQNSKNSSKVIKDSFVAESNSKVDNTTFINKSKKQYLTKENLIITLIIGVLASLIAAWIWSMK